MPKNRRRRVHPAIYLVLAAATLFFLLPLYVMLATSLKTMDEIRGGNVLTLPVALDFTAWVRAWSTACTGSTCGGISGGFLNSLKITVPSVILSTALGAVGGYTLSFWRFRGATVAYAILLFGLFVPFQVFIFPLIRISAAVGLYGTVAGIVLIHVTFGLPVTTLMFRNYFAAIPLELFKAARVDGAGYIRVFAAIMLPLSKPMIVVAVMWQATATWNDYIFGLVFAGRNNQPMTAQLQVLARSDTGIPEYNVIMAATLLTALVPYLYAIQLLRGGSAGEWDQDAGRFSRQAGRRRLAQLHRRFGVARVTQAGAVLIAIGLLGWESAREPWQLFLAIPFSGAGWR